MITCIPLRYGMMLINGDEWMADLLVHKQDYLFIVGRESLRFKFMGTLLPRNKQSKHKRFSSYSLMIWENMIFFNCTDTGVLGELWDELEEKVFSFYDLNK